MIKIAEDKLENALLICPDEFKEEILEGFSAEKRICDVRFMSLEEFRKKKYFDYDIRAIRYLRDRYGLSIANAKEILNNLYHVDEDRHYGIEKLDLLVKYSRELDEKGFLIHDPLFSKLIEGRRILVAGYGRLSREDEKMVEGEVIPFEWVQKKYQISSFVDIEEEVTYLYESIRELIYEQGIDINRIFVVNVGEDYASYFKRFNRYYPFSIDAGLEDVLIGSAAGKKFLAMIDAASKEEIYEELSQRDDEVSEKLIAILNRYPGYELREVKDFIEEDLRHTKLANVQMKDVVHCVSPLKQFEDDEHVFLIGFNDAFPLLKKDTDYITDSIALPVSVSLTEEKNEVIRDNVRACLSKIRNLRISFCEKSPFKKYELSNLLNEGEYEIVRKTADASAEKLQQTKLGYLLDKLHRYGIKEEETDGLYLAYPDLGYRRYDNRFKGLREDQIAQKEKVVLSYSSMDTFYKCRFAYYLKNILKIDDFDDTFFTKTGTLCHNVLRDLYEEKDFDFERSWTKNLNELTGQGKGFADEKEVFFASKMKEELKKDVEIVLKQKACTFLDRQLCENEFFVWTDPRIGFKGFIDKLMYRELPGEIIADVVDYKTGNTEIKEKLMPYGLSMQLPSYMYLLKKGGSFEKKISYGGFYLQHIINSELKFDENKDEKKIKEESMMLDGYTTSDMDRLSYCDITLEEGSSSIIKGLRLKKDGTLDSRSKVISDEQIDEKIALVEGLIRKAGEAILQGDFKIDPKQIDGENESCGYCPYRNICYRTYGDLNVISTKEKEKGHGEGMD